MLNSTVASMAAIMGGSHAHSVYAEQEHERMQSRIARNVSYILKEESHLNKVSDPLAGSYIIENMVHDIAKLAWTKFQSAISNKQ
jgi:methylmalonyl-CoA mutase